MSEDAIDNVTHFVSHLLMQRLISDNFAIPSKSRNGSAPVFILRSASAAKSSATWCREPHLSRLWNGRICGAT